jgi:DNA-binding response OmpR family regulator
MKIRWVLCIDEHREAGLLIATALCRLGYVVLRAQSYEHALANVQTVNFALYVISCQMPDNLVEDIYHQIRGYNDLAPIIFTAPATLPERIRSAVSADPNCFLGLPYELPGLGAKVSQLLK